MSQGAISLATWLNGTGPMHTANGLPEFVAWPQLVRSCCCFGFGLLHCLANGLLTAGVFPVPGILHRTILFCGTFSQQHLLPI